jgi:16S rRNA (cytosine967-C5)-methyltransferase
VTPGARLLSAIEFLDELATDERPADRALRAWFGARRYAGSKDRRTISRRVYTIIRSRARLDWWCARHLGAGEIGNRARVIASLVLTDGLDQPAIAALFDGGDYRPARLGAAERTLTTALDGHILDNAEQPAAVRGEFPDWLGESLHVAFDGAVVAELQALNQPAPLDLRVNRSKGDRVTALESLGAAGIRAEPAPLSPIGLRVADSPRIDDTEPFRSGLVEIQDEGSQIVAAMTDAAPGMVVVDYCAGAGGKTLALAAAMAGEGRLVACDTEARRLANMTPRLRRAGVADFVEIRELNGDDGQTDLVGKADLADLVGKADRVLADVPCSTSGAWRRDPASKWRLSRDRLDVYITAQRDILARAAALVRPGGCLVYATCSVLPEENEAQVEWFRGGHEDFTPVPAPELWHRTIGGACPCDGPYLRLSPARTGTDGYFIAVFRRAAA